MTKDKFQYFKNANNEYTVIFGANTETFDLIDVKKTEHTASLMCDILNDILRESQNLSTSDEALPIADVGGCTDLDIEDAASDCADYYEKQSGENLTAREKACFIDGYTVGSQAVRNRLTKKY